MLVWQIMETDKKEKVPFIFSKQLHLKNLLELDDTKYIISSHFMDHSTLCIITNTSQLYIAKLKLQHSQFCTVDYPFEYFYSLQQDGQCLFISIPATSTLFSISSHSIQLLNIPISKESLRKNTTWFPYSNELMELKMRRYLEQLDTLSKNYELKQQQLKIQNERIKCISQSTQLYQQL